ncbi:unnamed protein product [Rotaria magnacalcarata]|uniref:Uncharacterized protein n=1 Tax=Rotaria magnacalcarata TaxID=392030 RepID=A0A816WCP5_9BILA|nr:unnamed protein product [Rotaria magnacalcarata]CAF4094590.1 unnamed protein product [Rotaria magnacalcarata]
MNFFLVISLLVIFANTSHSIRFAKRLTENDLGHSRHGRVDNPNIQSENDVLFEPLQLKWLDILLLHCRKQIGRYSVKSAFQMNQCNNISYNTQEPLNRTKSFKIIQEMETTTCYHRVFVYDSNGSDLFVGTSERPMKTIQAVVSLTRILRTNHGNDKILCITIRGVTYYLGTNTTTTSSQIGAITLTTNDSNLVIENY